MATVKEYKGHKVPEGATHYGEETSNCFEGFWKRGDSRAYFWPVDGIQKWSLSAASSVPSHTVELPQEQEYMPKVGDSCEYTAIRDGDGQYSAILAGTWYECTKVIAFHDGHVWTSDNGIRPLKNTIFRPLKTEREKTVDAAIAVMNSSLDDSQQGWALALYDHGMLKMPEGES